jgi:hypothetical protein
LNHKRDPRLKKNQSRIEGVVNLCWAASQGDLSEAQKLAAGGVDLDGADYDGRTALPLAASDGQAHIVEYLIAKWVNRIEHGERLAQMMRPAPISGREQLGMSRAVRPDASPSHD